MANIASTALKLIGSLDAGSRAKRRAENEAAFQEQSALIVLEQGRKEARRRRRLVAQAQARNITATAKSGLTLEGSPTDVLEDNAIQGEIFADLAIQQAALQARALRRRATVARQGGRDAERAAQFGVAGALVEGVASFASSFKLPSPTPTGGTSGSLITAPSGELRGFSFGIIGGGV